MHSSFTKNIFTRLFATIVIFSTAANAHAQQDVADYMHVPGPIIFNASTYYLEWSAKPVDNYYKQQYVVKGDTIAHYKKLVLIDVLLDTLPPKELVYYKLRALEQRKKTDAAMDYHLITSPDSSEYIVDFIQSEGRPATEYVEWNAYLYKAFKDINGHKGVLLFGVSMRAYGNKITDFVGSMRDRREDVVKQLMQYPLPVVKISDN